MKYVDNAFFYHKEYAPDGRIFTVEDAETIESLSARGWVDDPAKFGANPWGDSPETEKLIYKTQQDFEGNLVPAIMDPNDDMSDVVRKQLETQAKSAQAEIAERDKRIRELESANEKLEKSKQQLMDEKNDAKTLTKKAASKANKSGTADTA